MTQHDAVLTPVGDGSYLLELDGRLVPAGPIWTKEQLARILEAHTGQVREEIDQGIY